MDVTALDDPTRWNLTTERKGSSVEKMNDAKIRAAAQKFETTFLAEMLKHTGIGKMTEGFSGGAGEAAFSGFLTWEYAEEIAVTGRIGLADRVYAKLIEGAGE